MKARRRLAGILFAVFGAILAAAPQAQSTLEEQLPAAFAPIVEAEIAAGRVAGAVVLVGQGPRVIYAAAFGRRALQPEAEAMTLDTVFDLASLTKVVATTPAILRLAERGAVALDAPVARYWPPFAAQGKQRITLRHLLAHTSGLPAGIERRPAERPADLRRRLAAIKPQAPPGGEPVYSDVNFAVLGEVVRRVSGQPLDRYVARRILKPLGMRDSGFLPAPAQRPRIAPTAAHGGLQQRGRVHDPLAAGLGGVAGNAGLFATAADLARFAAALLDGGRPILAPATVAQMFAPQTLPAGAQRGLGWRLDAVLAANRAALPPVGAASHLGYTGTGLWIDPVRGIYVVILTNRIHSNGGDAGPLRARVIAALSAAAGPLPATLIAERRPELAAHVAPYLPKAVPLPVKTGIDVLEEENFAPLHGLRVGLLTNRSGVDSAGRRSIDVLFRAAGVTLAALFSPEHGLTASREGRVGDDTDAPTGLPVYSLYGATRRPTAAMLDGLDALVVDLQDAGTRFYTYASTLAYAMEAAAERGLQIVVLDRPNPLNAAAVQGPLLDAERRGFTGYWPLPIRHGLTLGEFAGLFKAEAGLPLRLTVIAMRGYRRDQWYDDTGLPWLPPSPNLTSLAAALLYPGVGMIEGAEVSVGRGTATPFERVGAPWIDGRRLADELERMALPGLRFVAAEFVPATGPYAGAHCHGVRIEVTARDELDTPALGIALAATLHRLYPENFSLAKTLGNVGNQTTLDAIRNGTDPQQIVAGWRPPLAAYRTRRAPYLLYP
ncbi:MAG: DUF1343 domain-containing protein [Rhodocyclaceae bacterium]|nr:DUF1343 domain-containing protein [Rhodocyclaceae bacterium]